MHRSSQASVLESIETLKPSKSSTIMEPVPTNGHSNEDQVKPVQQPFQRKAGAESKELLAHRCRVELCAVLHNLAEASQEVTQLEIDLMNEPNDEVLNLSPTLLNNVTDVFASLWKLKDHYSEIAFKGLLIVLEYCLSTDLKRHETFRYFVEALGFHTVFFWKKAVPLIYDSDMQFSNFYRDALLFSLVLYDVDGGRNRLRELFAAVPGIRDSFLGKHAKRFEELHHAMMRSRTSSICGNSSTADLRALDDDSGDEGGRSRSRCSSVSAHGKKISSGGTSELSEEDGHHATGSNCGELETVPESIVAGGLAHAHLDKRVINVSNAPPVSLTKRRESGEWTIGQGSGGLVSCCAPVMEQDPENLWLACFGPGVPIGADPGSKTPTRPPTNSLGLPILRKTAAEVHSEVLQTNLELKHDEAASTITKQARKQVAEQMSLLGVLKNYSKDSYKLNPVLVNEDDYNNYYGGISNGLIWPALHNLPEYILKDYDDEELLQEHWRAYIRANYQFALNSVRRSRPQDFIWIHDYHLTVVGLIIQSLDPHLDVGFFLHIPFQLPDDFFDKYAIVGMGILRGLLRFSKIGFQTHRDRASFVEQVKTHLGTGAKIRYDTKHDTIKVSFEGWTASMGVFPVSVKNEEYLQYVHDTTIQKNSAEIRDTLLGGREGKLYFGVERFDYTKGIKEKLLAYRRYLEKYPERLGKDVYLQVAVINRRSVDTYAQYQDECMEQAEEINRDFKLDSDPDWKPLVFRTTGFPRPELVAHYMAMDIGVVTPKKDGMNLVAKEMLICNPGASIILSSGAGTEQQLSNAGFYNDERQCYHRIENVYDTEKFADTFYEAAIQTPEDAAAKGKELSEFLLSNDIEKWSKAFLDPHWTHQVIQACEVHTLSEFYNLMFMTRNIRRQIVERIMKGIPIRTHFAMSLKSAKESLEMSCLSDSTTLKLHVCDLHQVDTTGKSADDSPQSNQNPKGPRVTLDVSDEIRELDRDMDFLDFLEKEDPDNVVQFLNKLANYHVNGSDEYHREVETAINLLSEGDYFQYFFSDRDGTLKGYACSYASSIQPCYSGVIQANFVRRCTHYAAIVTSAPLLNVGILDVSVIPDNYFCYGASVFNYLGGREWYINAAKKFKDTTLDASDLSLLRRVADEIEVVLEERRFTKFRWLGSGLQTHYGHVTVAKQDCYGSVNVKDTEEFVELVKELVERLDKERKLDIHATETDIKIYPRSGLTNRVFTKANGIRLFAQEMHLQLSQGNILICGDSESDLPMLKELLALNPENTYAIFVTQNAELQEQVAVAFSNASRDNNHFVFVSDATVILGAMAHATIREITVRPVDDSSVCDDVELFDGAHNQFNEIYY